MNDTQNSLKNSKNLVGRPVLSNDKKRHKRIVFYLNDEEYKKFIYLEKILPINTSSFFRYIINKSDINFLSNIGINIDIPKNNNLKETKKISLSNISKSLSIKENSLRKIFNKIGIKRKIFFSKSDLIFIKDNISDKHYRKRLLKVKFDTLIEKM